MDSRGAAREPLRRVLLIANPISGSGRNQREAPRFADELRKFGIASEIRFTERRGDAPELARAGAAAGFDVIVAVGGDGTLREVCQGAAGRVPVGLYPTGTANVLARELGIPRSARGAAAVLAANRVERIDSGRANGELVLFVLGVGLDAEILTRLESTRRGAISYASYLGPICQVLTSFDPPEIRVSLDGRTPQTCQFLLVSNTRYYAGPWVRFGAGPSLADGLFEVYRFAMPTRRALVATAARALVGGIPGGRVTRERARHVRIESRPAAPTQIDGDRSGPSPIEFEVAPRSLPLIVPPAFVL